MSGAQLSNYATYLVEPEQAPLSIVLTALSTACGVVATPLLALLMLGQRVPVDAKGMSLSIMQIVIMPVAAGKLERQAVPTYPSSWPVTYFLLRLQDCCSASTCLAWCGGSSQCCLLSHCWTHVPAWGPP